MPIPTGTQAILGWTELSIWKDYKLGASSSPCKPKNLEVLFTIKAKILSIYTGRKVSLIFMLRRSFYYSKPAKILKNGMSKFEQL